MLGYPPPPWGWGTQMADHPTRLPPGCGSTKGGGGSPTTLKGGGGYNP